jgi:hypothetical protein
LNRIVLKLASELKAPSKQAAPDSAIAAAFAKLQRQP